MYAAVYIINNNKNNKLYLTKIEDLLNEYKNDKDEVMGEIVKRKNRYLSLEYDKNIDINKVGKSGFTTKGVGHGFGLSIVKDIAKTNPEIETFNSKESNKFIQTAMIYFKK